LSLWIRVVLPTPWLPIIAILDIKNFVLYPSHLGEAR
jgi:hypothetical protein